MKKFLKALTSICQSSATIIALQFFVVHKAFASVGIPKADEGIGNATEATANTAVGLFLNRIVTLIFWAAIPIALYAVFMTAFTLLKSPGDPAGYQKVKKNLTAILIGFIILAVGAAAVKFVISVLRV